MEPGVGTDVIAGVTARLTMAYIFFVDPTALGSVADPSGTNLPFTRCTLIGI